MKLTQPAAIVLSALLVSSTAAFCAENKDEAKDKPKNVQAEDVRASAKHLVGKWTLDAIALMERVANKAVLAQMKIEVTFTADGNMTVVSSFNGNNEPQKGTWKLIEPKGSTATLETKTAGRPERTTIRFSDKDNFEVDNRGAPEPFNKMPFTRSQPKPKIVPKP